MGVTLMMIGVCCFVVGFVLNFSPKKTAEPVTQSIENYERASLSPPLDEPKSLPNSIYTPPSPSSSTELEEIVSMAVADGVLTPNERNLIKDFANSRGLTYTVIIRDVEKRIASSGAVENEIIDINKKKGDDFEKFVVQKFNKRFFKLKGWTGDKYVNGVYAETTLHPDLLLEHSADNQTSEFAVECKWRSDFFNNGIVFTTPEQLTRYQDFAASRKIPVFIAIGIGGEASNPKHLYIVPLRVIKSSFIPNAILTKFQKQIDKNFVYYTDSKKLM